MDALWFQVSRSRHSKNANASRAYAWPREIWVYVHCIIIEISTVHTYAYDSTEAKQAVVARSFNS
jgi:hypothetical protein